MTLLYATGWDLCTTLADAQLDGWSGAGGGGGSITDIQTSNGRTGGACIRFQRGTGGGNGPVGVVRTLGTIPGQFFVGFALNAVTSITTTTIFFCLDTGAVQINLILNTDGSLTLQRNQSVTLGSTSAGAVSFGTYHYYEIGGVIATGTGGSVTVRRDMTTLISVTGVNTQATGNASWNQIQFGGGVAQSAGVDFRFDDLYVCDNNGSINNNFLGDIGVKALLPNAAGSNSGFTQFGGSGGGNYTSVNEKPNDGDTSYVSANVVTTEDTYKYPGLSVNTTAIYGVLSKPVIRKDDVGLRHVTTHYRHSDTTEGDFTGTDFTLTTSYAQFVQLQELNPRTGVAWTSTDLSLGEFGPKVSQ